MSLEEFQQDLKLASDYRERLIRTGFIEEVKEDFLQFVQGVEQANVEQAEEYSVRVLPGGMNLGTKNLATKVLSAKPVGQTKFMMAYGPDVVPAFEDSKLLNCIFFCTGKWVAKPKGETTNAGV